MMSSVDAQAGRQLAFEMLGGSDGAFGPSPEELLESGAIDIEEYRRRIAAGGGVGGAPPAGTPKLTSAPSHGSAGPRSASKAPPRRASFEFEELPEHPVVLDGKQRQAAGASTMSLSGSSSSGELSRLRQSEAELAEQLQAKEEVLQEVLQQLGDANKQLLMSSTSSASSGGGGGGGSRPPLSKGLSRASSTASSSSMHGSREDLLEQIEANEQALEEMAATDREKDKEIAALRAKLSGRARPPKLSDEKGPAGKGYSEDMPAAAAARTDGTRPSHEAASAFGASSESALGGGSAADDTWTLTGFLDSLQLSEELAEALLGAEHAGRAGGWFGDKGASVKSDLDFVRGLAASNASADMGVKTVLDLLNRGGVLEVIAKRVWQGIDDLVQVQAGGSELAGKWTSGQLNKYLADEGAMMMSYTGLNTFFSGLEGKVGAPQPKVLIAMTNEHTLMEDSSEPFTAGNYVIKTTSEVEWRFVADPTKAPKGGWPKETKNQRIGDASVERMPMPLKDLRSKRSAKNARLKLLGEPELMIEEAIGSRLYTGPLFAKYNAVLRGLDSKAPFLRNQMVELCCSKQTYAKYMGGANPGDTPRGAELSYEAVATHLNLYTTTLHAINSAIVKLSKLTYACKVYRGINNRVLPKEFWEANEYGVRGGIEAAFMSTVRLCSGLDHSPLDIRLSTIASRPAPALCHSCLLLLPAALLTLAQSARSI